MCSIMEMRDHFASDFRLRFRVTCHIVSNFPTLSIANVLSTILIGPIKQFET